MIIHPDVFVTDFVAVTLSNSPGARLAALAMKKAIRSSAWRRKPSFLAGVLLYPFDVNDSHQEGKIL